ncbi:MAG: hypothetical protein IKE31_03755 [Eubacterium sp.]|nr:hypothetical protein [Eubacterium sp.]
MIDIDMIALKEIEKHIEALRPVAGHLRRYDAPFLLFALDAYRETIAKQFPEAVEVTEELKEFIKTKSDVHKVHVGKDGKAVRFTIKKGKG